MTNGVTSSWPDHFAAKTVHTRIGEVKHRFAYSVDYVLIDPTVDTGPMLFSRNKRNLFSVHDRDHGGKRGDGRGLTWVRNVLEQRGVVNTDKLPILLLTQPRFFGYVFNPVSFWLVYDNTDLVAVIAEVNNTFGDRHSYYCALPDQRPISPDDSIAADKVFHVSPFQDIAGTYAFQFNISDDHIGIVIRHVNGSETMVATLAGRRRPLGNRHLLTSVVRRPVGALRTVALIYWQALRLKLKGAAYRARPTPPKNEVS